MKKKGSFFPVQLGILLVCYLFAPHYLFRFIFLFLAFMLIASKLYSTYLYRNLHIYRLDKELRTFRHEWLRVDLVVENHGYVPALMLAFRDMPDRLPVYRENRQLCSIRGRSRIHVTWYVYCSIRGLWTLGPALVQGSDPLGLFPFSITTNETSTLFVYPARRNAFLNISGGIPLGSRQSPNPLDEDLTRYRSLRPYTAGDELHRINWKASAHGTAGIVVNEYEATGTFPLMIVLNRNCAAYPLVKRGTYSERAIEIAAALTLMAAREKQDVGIFITDPVSVIMPGTWASIPILERLAALPEEAPESGQSCVPMVLEQARRLRYGTRVMYVGANCSDEEYLLLNSLKRYRFSLEYCILDEHQLPALVPGNSRRYNISEETGDLTWFS